MAGPRRSRPLSTMLVALALGVTALFVGAALHRPARLCDVSRELRFLLGSSSPEQSIDEQYRLQEELTTGFRDLAPLVPQRIKEDVLVIADHISSFERVRTPEDVREALEPNVTYIQASQEVDRFVSDACGARLFPRSRAF